MATLRIMATGTADVDSIRSETLRGRTYTVVPVVALVEGVLQGLNASAPEFAPASEFGKFPMTWNARPITLNHPSRDGVLCSAGDPDVRDEFEFGFLANSVLEDKKLKTEAWIDDALVEEKGGEFLELRDNMLAGEMCEVSTGLFCDVFEKKGSYSGTKYAGVWANCVPDHLAFLPNAIGACSIEDGCGAPRLNNGSPTPKAARIGSPVPEAQAHTHAQGSCCDACAKTGGSCMSTNVGGGNGTTGAEEPAAEPIEHQPQPEPENQPGSGEEGAEAPAAPPEDTGATGSGEEVGTPGTPEAPETPADPEEIAAQVAANASAAETFSRFVNNAVDPAITFENARTIVQEAIRVKFPEGRSDCGCYYYSYCWIMAMNADWVAFERRVNDAYQTVAIQYSVDENGGVTFTGEPVPVNLIVKIVPKPETVVNANAADGAVPGANQQQKEGQMADELNAGTEGNAGGEQRVNGAGDPPAQPRTLEAFLADAPPEVAAVVNEGIALRTQKKNNLVKGILANSSVFSEDELNAKEIPELEKLAAMARPVTDFSGRPLPQPRDLNVNEQRNQMSVPEPIRAFSAKPVRRADYSEPGTDSAAA